MKPRDSDNVIAALRRRRLKAAAGIVCAFCAVLAGCLAASTAWATEPTLTPNALEERLAARFKGDRSGACVVAVVVSETASVRGRVCAGTRSSVAPPPDPKAAYEIGSISQSMLGVLVAGLVDGGKWSLDDPIARHLPPDVKVPQQGDRQIRVRDLLTHRSGLPTEPTQQAKVDPSNPYAELTEAELLQSLAHVPLTRPIGSAAEYSNFGTMLLSLAVARSTGGNLDAAMWSSLFEPLAMNEAFIDWHAGDVIADAHVPGGNGGAAYSIQRNLAGVGMVFASLPDMDRYLHASLGEGPIELVARLRRTQEPLDDQFTMGWTRLSLGDHKLLLQDSGNAGYSSTMILEPATHRGVVLLSDTALMNLGGLRDLGLALLGFDVPVAPPRRTVDAPKGLVKALEGDYQLGKVKIRIWEDGDKLKLRATEPQALELRYDSQGDFYPVGMDALLTPLGNSGDGSPVRAFTWRQGGGLAEAERLGLPVDTAAHPLWREWTGTYQLTPQFAIAIFERGGRLMVQGSGQGAVTATPLAGDRIEVKDFGASMEFERDAAGHVVAMLFHQDGQSVRGERK